MYTLYELCILENIFKSLNMVLSEQIHLIWEPFKWWNDWENEEKLQIVSRPL